MSAQAAIRGDPRLAAPLGVKPLPVQQTRFFQRGLHKRTVQSRNSRAFVWRYRRGRFHHSASGTALDRVLAALPHARRRGAHWIAPCPAHEDRHPSLSIRAEGDRVLLHCFSGCSVVEVVSALGLIVADLFDEPHRKYERSATRRPPTQDEVRDALRREAERVLHTLADAGIIGELLVSEWNAIRARVARRLAVELAPLPIPYWDGGPHSRDPLWPALCEHYWTEVWIEREGVIPPTLEEHARTTGVLRGRERKFYFVAEERAAQELHRVASHQGSSS